MLIVLEAEKSQVPTKHLGHLSVMVPFLVHNQRLLAVLSHDERD